jgi:two-component system, NtrC family, nitrogen regulation sensor histidine kinase NtrY
MTLRIRLALLVSGLVVAAVALVTWYVTASARQAFETVDAQRSRALLAQIRREFDRERADTARRLDGVAASEPVQRLAVELAMPGTDTATFLREAAALASANGLDFLDLVGADDDIVSSAHWPARFGYRHPWAGEAQAAAPPFLEIQEGPEGRTLGLVGLREVRAAERPLRLAGGRRLDRQFLLALDVPPGMRVLLYPNLDAAFSAAEILSPAGGSGTLPEATLLEPLILRAVGSRRDTSEVVNLPGGAETFSAIPLAGRGGQVLAVLLVGSSHRELDSLLGAIRRTGFLVGAVGLVLGILLAYLLAAGITRPIERLAELARAVASGDWSASVDESGGREVAALGSAFNLMTSQLADQRERLVQVERVAAWRELARRLAHELKNPLFPLRITVENLQRARALPPSEFAEVFDESTATLAAGINSLTGIVGRFGDFARMPKPEFEDVDVNEVARRALTLVAAPLSAPGRPLVEVSSELDPDAGRVRADPEQVGRALQNLLLNAIDAMPSGGRLALRTRRDADHVTLEIADTGQGLTEEERTRLFTPYYTTKQHGTGLGLAIVQSIVSDHAGRISVASEPGRGTTFTIRLPLGVGIEPPAAAGGASA